MPDIFPLAGLQALAEARENSLDEFFSKDPLLLSQTDLSKIVVYYRELRARWATAELAGAIRAPSSGVHKVPAKPKAKEAKPPADVKF